MQTIVFLGGGVDSLGIIRRAARMGLKCVVVDGDPHAPAFKFNDVVPVIRSCYEPWETLEGLARTKIKPSAVLCAGVDAPHIMSAIASHYDLVGPSQSAANFSRHKWAQKKLLASAGVNVPVFLAMEKHLLPMEVNQDSVIKPVDSRGARGVIRFKKGDTITVDHYHESMRARSYRAIHDVMMEVWVDGPQLSSESIVQDGEILFTAFAERNYDKLDKYAPYVIEDGSLCPPDIQAYYENDWRHKADAELQKCVEALGFKNGTIKGDLVWDGDKIWVIEVALRLSGGRFCSDIIPRAYNVDFVGMAIRMALGDKIWPGEIMPRMNGYLAQRFEFPIRDVRCHPDRGKSFLAWGGYPGEAIGRVEEMVYEYTRKRLATMEECN